jgi:uncharacterized protein Yka (UPF0111/DUF47 family)
LAKSADFMFNFSPHKEKFFDLFRQSAENTAEGAKVLNEMLVHYDNPQESWKKLKDIEHEGDRITHRTIRS